MQSSLLTSYLLQILLKPLLNTSCISAMHLWLFSGLNVSWFSCGNLDVIDCLNFSWEVPFFKWQTGCWCFEEHPPHPCYEGGKCFPPAHRCASDGHHASWCSRYLILFLSTCTLYTEDLLFNFCVFECVLKNSLASNLIMTILKEKVCVDSHRC